MFYGIWNVKEGDKFTCFDNEGEPITRRVLRNYPPMPEHRDWLRSANHTIVFFGDHEEMFWSPVDTVLAYNEETNAWESTTPNRWGW